MKDIHHFANLGVRLANSEDHGVFVHSISRSSLVVKIKKK